MHIYFCIFMGMSACMDGTFCYFKSKLSDLSSDPLPVWVNFRDSETNWDSSVHHLYPFVDFFNLNVLVWLSFSLQNTLSLLIHLRWEKVDMACKFRLPFFIKKKKKWNAFNFYLNYCQSHQKSLFKILRKSRQNLKRQQAAAFSSGTRKLEV